MATKKSKKTKKEAPAFYKGYDIKWLKKLGAEHADFSLVAEYEAEYGEIK